MSYYLFNKKEKVVKYYLKSKAEIYQNVQKSTRRRKKQN